MRTTTRERLIEEVAGFCEMTAISRREFGVRATGNPSFWARLVGSANDGVSLTLKTVERAEEFMRDYDPDLEPPTAPRGRPRRAPADVEAAAPGGL